MAMGRGTIKLEQNAYGSTCVWFQQEHFGTMVDLSRFDSRSLGRNPRGGRHTFLMKVMGRIFVEDRVVFRAVSSVLERDPPRVTQNVWHMFANNSAFQNALYFIARIASNFVFNWITSDPTDLRSRRADLAVLALDAAPALRYAGKVRLVD